MDRRTVRRRRLMLWIAVPASLYATVVLLLFLLQDKLIFIGAGWGKGQPLPELPGVTVRELALPGGERFRVAVGEPRGAAQGVIVFFIGNGEDLRSGVHWASQWAAYDLVGVVVEYPGYGESEGTCGVEDFFAAADCAAAFAAERARALGVPLFCGGSSIGAFSAVHVAAQGIVARMFLRAPPTSLAEAAQRHYPWLPVRWLLRHRFDNLALADQVRCETLILHGDRDRIVPDSMGRELAQAFAGPTDFVSAEGYGHNDLSCDAQGPFGARIRAFVRAP